MNPNPTADALLVAAMQAEKWKQTYIDDLIKHMTAMRTFGVSNVLKQSLIQKHKADGYLLTAADGARSGQQFGTLRGDGMAVEAYEKYMRSAYGYEADEIIGLVVQYAKGVRSSSWAPMVQIVKAFFVDERTEPAPDAYFWKNIADTPQPWSDAELAIRGFKAKQLGDAFTPTQISERDAKLRAAIVSWHAFMQELLTNTTFPGNDQQARTVTVVRTESSDAAKSFLLNGSPLSSTQLDDLQALRNTALTGKRGALESSSMYTVKNIHGHLVAEYKVPYHRVFGLYMTAQPMSSGHMTSFFENDTENELSFMPEGLTFVLKNQDELAFAAPTKPEERGLF